ncbi:MAG: hypothetical protein RL645_71 [Actinomycetota bacterium]
MFTDRFDETSETDILRYAAGLIGKSLAEVVELPESELERDRRGKGRLGNLVEEFYFGYKPNSNPEPDFPKAGLELKVTGLKSVSPNPIKAKERLVLNMINFHELVNETFETSSFYKKCQKILILCYLYDKAKLEVDQIFTENQFIFRLVEQELSVIKRDWELIQSKVKAGLAHEISEGDTFYLKANRKGAGGEKDLTEQPFSSRKANRRSWSFNNGFMTSVIAGAEPNSGSLGIAPGETFEQATHRRLAMHLGKPSRELFEEFGLVRDGVRISKSARYDLLVRILSDGGSSVQELKKAGIRLKTIRLKVSGRTREAMSFQSFDYCEIVNQEWENSDFSQILEAKFLFAVFQEGLDGVERFVKAEYWNMPFADRQEAQQVWEETRQRIILGRYEFPQSSENAVSHVRPHARNAEDKIMCPDGEKRMKRSFWLNQRYIERVVAEI